MKYRIGSNKSLEEIYVHRKYFYDIYEIDERIHELKTFLFLPPSLDCSDTQCSQFISRLKHTISCGAYASSVIHDDYKIQDAIETNGLSEYFRNFYDLQDEVVPLKIESNPL